MSLITCCPACGTMFKVVPDQLRISEGWVRCGHCAEVFDATTHMQGEEGAAAPAVLAPEVHGQEVHGPEVHEQDLAPAPESLREPEPPREQTAPHEPPPPQAPAYLQAPTTEPHIPLPLSPAPADYHSYPPFELPRNEYDEFAPLAAPDPGDPFSGPPDSQLEPALEDVSFVRQARRKAFWRSGGMRALLAFAAVALAALLALQFAVQERDRVAAGIPALRPLLDAVCEPMDCKVGPPRQIEAIAIDSSTFNKLRGDAYKLAFTLKNQAAMPVAMPALELTLTDSQDQPLVRRVLMPAELGATTVIGPSADWSGNLAFNLSPGNPGGRVAGYRLLAFYP